MYDDEIGMADSSDIIWPDLDFIDEFDFIDDREALGFDDSDDFETGEVK